MSFRERGALKVLRLAYAPETMTDDEPGCLHITSHKNTQALAHSPIQMKPFADINAALSDDLRRSLGPSHNPHHHHRHRHRSTLLSISSGSTKAQSTCHLAQLTFKAELWPCQDKCPPFSLKHVLSESVDMRVKRTAVQ